MKLSLQHAVRHALWAQTAWALLSAVWNLAGIALQAWGQKALGPSPTLIGFTLAIGFVVALWLAVERSPFINAVLTSAAGLLGLAAALKPFTADPALWASQSLRYAGATLNAVGFIAAGFAMSAFINWSDRVSKWQHPTPAHKEDCV
ncbi:MAG TPA: hypothetical protein PLR35_11265 [Burkholderiaceae bacterium]|nr:hypothetical protein [Burkholderiaceae bacterium]